MYMYKKEEKVLYKNIYLLYIIPILNTSIL